MLLVTSQSWFQTRILLLLVLMKLQEFFFGRNLLPSVERATCMNAVITPTADDVRRAFNVFEVGQLALPVVIEVGMLESTIGSIFHKVAAPVPEYRVSRCKSVLQKRVIRTVSWNCFSQATELRFRDSSLECHLAVKIRHSVDRNDGLNNTSQGQV